jgi:hypothetical protein
MCEISGLKPLKQSGGFQEKNGVAALHGNKMCFAFKKPIYI